ncbi:MAG: DUF4012 domain-containing protein [Anaerolineales bacterium]|nr:DUF4012 domain-containing protein [Anaerolineales bacterium]
MTESDENVDNLKVILENLRDPQALDSHPWATSKLAEDAAANGKNSGQGLVSGIIRLFHEMKPSMPPRKGKRLDTRWGEFGLLAAYYFAPVVFNIKKPSSLREAWRSIDKTILLFVFGQENVSDEERAQYRLIGGESEIAPDSTISDWHRKGIERFAELVTQENKRLENQPVVTKTGRTIWKPVAAIFGVLLLASLIFGTITGWKFYQRAMVIKQKIDALESYLSPSPKVDQIGEIAPLVHDLRVEVDALNADAAPYLGLTQSLGWVPTYGSDLAQAPDLLEMAVSLGTAADEGIQALMPSLDAVTQHDQTLDVLAVLKGLQEAEPKLLSAQIALAQAQAARDRINSKNLSPYLKKIIEVRIDPLLDSIAGQKFPMEDALALVHSAPHLLGVGKDGPQTYLLMIQNEDELRATGGFLTAVGSAVVKDGKLLSINIESSDFVDDLSKPYPKSPWQLDEYMMAEFLVLRDANWFTNFPTSVEWIEYLYSYSRAYSVDGVIAVDQHVIVELLKALGPVRVDDVSFDITHENVLEYMRAAKERRPPGTTARWDRKQFIGRLAKPLLEKVLNARGTTWSKLAPVLIKLLDERHILLQFDDLETTKLLERRKWDGAIRPPQNSDYLMVVDSNIGFNKSNVSLSTSLAYNIDLSSLNKPTGNLIVKHTNRSQSNLLCEPRLDAVGVDMSEAYTMDACHWTYLRVYKPVEAQLTDAAPQVIPAEQTLRQRAIPARIDLLENEEIPNTQVFGTFLVIPQKETINTSFEFSLPAFVLQKDPTSDAWTYRLILQKQPGTISTPVTISLLLPEGSELLNAPAGLKQEQGRWIFTSDLRQDIIFDVEFRVP